MPGKSKHREDPEVKTAYAQETQEESPLKAIYERLAEAEKDQSWLDWGEGYRTGLKVGKEIGHRKEWTAGRRSGLKDGREQGRRLGKREGMQDVVLHLLKSRFDPVSDQILEHVQTIKSVKKLTELAQQATEVSSLEELGLPALQRMTPSSRKPSARPARSKRSSRPGASKMRRMTYADQMREEGRQEGLAEAKQEGQQLLVIGILGNRFGALSEQSEAYVRSIQCPEEIFKLAKRALAASSLQELGLA